MTKSESTPEALDSPSPTSNDEDEVIGNFFGTVDIEVLAEEIAAHFYPHEVEYLLEELRRRHVL